MDFVKATFIISCLVFTIANLQERAWSLSLPGPQTPICPMKCRCITVSRTRSSASRLLEQYADMFDWEDGKMAAVCWGKMEIPKEILPDVSYLLLVGDHSRMGSIKYDVIDATSVSEDGHLNQTETSRIKRVPPGTFENATQLIQLDLRGNRISELDSGSLEGLESLEVLSLKGNRLKTVPGDALRSTLNLTGLFLSGNNIRELHKDSFIGNPNLLDLDLGDNLLDAIPSGSFDNQSNLRFLNLSHNRLEELPRNLFSNVSDLQTLILDNNRLESLPRDLFKKNSKLRVVSLKNNRLQSLEDFTFFHQVDLLELDLSGNNLISMRESMFSPSPELLRLDVSRNRLIKLNKQVFANCSNLREIDASFNELKEVTSETLGELPSLQRLNLAGNNISKIEPRSLQGLPNLETLELSNNTLRSLQADIFFGLGGLTSLSLDGNRISEVQPGSFNVGRYSMSSKLTWLYMRGNRLKALAPQMFHGAPFVKMLNVADNQIDYIDPSALSSMRSLVTLSLRGNRLGSLQEAVFLATVKIQSLDLSQNSLHLVQEGAFQGLTSLLELNMADNELDETSVDWLSAVMTSLTRLDLSSNRFTNIPSHLLTSLPNLRQLFLARNILDKFKIPDEEQLAAFSVLDISNNNLQTIEGGLHTIMAAGSSLDLSGNPWICDCALASDVKLLMPRGVHLHHVEETYCEGQGNKQRGQLLEQVYKDSALCQHQFSPVLSSTRFKGLVKSITTVLRTSCRSTATVSKDNGTWPWYGMLWDTKRESALCNTALIGSEWAVTTLRCLQQIQANMSSTMPNLFRDIVRRERDSLLMAPEGLVIRLGKSKQLLEFEPGEQAHKVMNIHIPANKRGTGLDRPVLLQFASMAKVTDNIGPICIAETQVKGQRGITLGWGKKSKDTSPNDKLQDSRMKLVLCNLPEDALLCGVREKGRFVDYSIEGNMGGALAMKRGRGDWVLLGIGTRIEKQVRPVFIDLRKFADWIEQKMELSGERH